MFKQLSLFSIFCLWLGALFAAPTVIYENLRVEKIEIQMVSPKESSGDAMQVRAKMKTREGDLFSQNDFDQDLKNLSQEFDRIDPQFRVAEGKLIIFLKVWPKPTIRSINYVGNTKKSAKTLQKELGIAVCSVFDRLAFNQAFHKLKTYYVKKGFFEAELDYTPVYDECTNEVDITITVNEGRSGRIKAIKFMGFDSCEQSEILDKMVTKEYNLFLSWLNDEGTFREDAMQHDQFQILNYLQNKGYADAQVNIQIQEADCNNRIVIIISAERGQIYTVGKIRFCGNTLFKDEEIFSHFNFIPGDPYSPEKIRETISNVTELYGRYGYIDAYMSFEPTLEGERVYTVDFEIEEGEQFRVGLLKVFGNCTTQTNVILQETLLIPGEVFNVEKLKLTERRLENIGYFKKVNVYAVKTEGALPGNYRDVHIEVEETSTGKIGFFFGFSTTENLFGGVNLSENNFNMAGIPYAWKNGVRALRGGGEYLNMAVQVGNRSRSYTLSWTKPYFMDTKWSVGFDIEKNYNNYISKDLDIDALGLTLRAGRQLNAFLRFQGHYRIKDSHTHFDGDRSELHHDPQLRQAVKNDGAVSATGITLTYDSTDSPLNPTSGFKSQLEGEVAGLGGNYDFFSYAYLNTYYYPFTERLIIKYRADLKFISTFGGTTYETLPMDERLFLGGNTLVRGYRPYRIGPIFDGTDIPSGGLTLQYFSTELNYRFSKRFDGFLFMDLGHLSEKQWNFDWNRYRGALGFGLRVTLLDSLPPISVGFGFPINPADSSEVKRFFMQFGCKF